MNCVKKWPAINYKTEVCFWHLYGQSRTFGEVNKETTLTLRLSILKSVKSSIYTDEVDMLTFYGILLSSLINTFP